MSGLYDKGREGIAGAIDLLADTLKVLLVHTSAGGTAYVVDLAAHQYLSDIAAGARIATSGALASKTVTSGVLNAANITLSAVAGGAGTQVDAVVIFKDTGVAGTSPLICWIDTASAGLPVQPNGGDITVQWDTGTNRIFKL